MPIFGAGVSLGRICRRLYRLRRGVAVGIVAALANPLAVFALLGALAIVTDAGTFGVIAVTAGFTGIPVILLAPASRQILQRGLSRQISGRDLALSSVLTQHLLQWLPLAVAIAMIGWVLGPLVMPPLLGEGWLASASYIGPLTLVGAIQLCLSPIGVVFPMTGTLHWQLGLDLVRGGAIAAWVILASRSLQPSSVVLGGAIVMGLGYLAMYAAARVALSRWASRRVPGLRR